MLFKSPILGSVSGSIAGGTWSHNAGGMYIRSRAIPTNPNSVYQQAVRSRVSQLSNLWSSELTQDQRDAWDTYAVTAKITNPLGDQISISGFNHYIRSNVPRLQAGATRIDDGPTEAGNGAFTPVVFTADESTQLISVAYTNTDDWAAEVGSYLLVYGSRPKPPTINYCKGPYRYLGKVQGASPTPPTSPFTIAPAFPFVEGQRIFCRVQVSRADGRLSSSQLGFCLAAA